jgi:hypothetical protein
VDLAYARTDMRSQGRTERRALLALDGIEDMQGGYVQLTRSTDRTDLYLTVGPEPLGPDDERPHPAQEARAPEEMLARVLTRDGSKTLATDTPDLLDVRRLSTRELRAERDRLAQLRAECPPDRSRELRLAAQRAAEAEQARRQARTDHQAAAEAVAALAGSWRRRRELPAARDRLVLAEHGLRTTTGQADQAAERLGVLRRAQQRHLGWMEAHDGELRVQERALTRELGWRGRVDQRALVLDPPGWLVAELGPVPTDPRERAVWRVAAAELDGYRRVYGFDHERPAEHGGAGWPRTGGRLSRPRPRPRRGTAGSAGRRGAAAASVPAHDSGRDANWWPPRDATRSMRAGCWAPSPAATPGAAGATGSRFAPRWSGWPTTTAAAVTTVTARLSVPAGCVAAISAARNATAASWKESHLHQHEDPDDFHHEDLDLYDDEDDELGRPVYRGDGLTVRELTAEELQRFLDAHQGQAARLLGSGWAALDPPGDALAGPRTPPAAAVAAVPAEPVTGSHGSPGRSALVEYRRRRAEELAAWTRTLAWRAPLVAGAGLAGQVLAAQVGLPRAGLVGLALAALVGWRLRFRPSERARTWQRGAHGERHTARLLDRLTRDGYAVFHDLAVPGSPANVDHLVIGPSGVFVIDSKLWTGSVHQGADGLVWHNHYPLDRTLETVRWEAQQVSRVLGTRAAALLCVHDAHVHGGGLYAPGVAIVPAHLLRGALGYDRVLSDADVELLTATARVRLRPASSRTYS